MQNEVAEVTEATRSNELENLSRAAKAGTGFEKLLKFRKGKYFSGEDEVPLGTEFVAHITNWTKVWTKFADSKVVARKMYRVAAGETIPRRDELDDAQLIGTSDDPWSFQQMLPLEDVSSGQVGLFITSTVGGRAGIAELCDAYVNHTRQNPGNASQPVVRLAVEEMATKNYGKVPRPSFKVVGWDDVESGVAAETSLTTVIPVQEVVTKKAAANKRDDIDDEIPF